VLRRRGWDELVGYREHAPDVELAHPTPEHLRPIFVAAGAAAEDERVSFPTTGWEWGTISRRSVQFG
jgi:4,5-DOPA dioxygenase extradiol